MYVPIIVHRDNRVLSGHTSLLGTLGSDNTMATGIITNGVISVNADMVIMESDENTTSCGKRENTNPRCLREALYTHPTDREMLDNAAAWTECVFKITDPEHRLVLTLRH